MTALIAEAFRRGRCTDDGPEVSDWVQQTEQLNIFSTHLPPVVTQDDIIVSPPLPEDWEPEPVEDLVVPGGIEESRGWSVQMDETKYPVITLPPRKPEDDDPPEEHCCVRRFDCPQNVQFRVFRRRDALGDPVMGLFWAFTGEAEFIDDLETGCDCSCCEFRQYVKHRVRRTCNSFSVNSRSNV